MLNLGSREQEAEAKGTQIQYAVSLTKPSTLTPHPLTSNPRRRRSISGGGRSASVFLSVLSDCLPLSLSLSLREQEAEEHLMSRQERDASGSPLTQNPKL